MQCTKPLIDLKTGKPRYDCNTCGPECLKTDRQEKLAAKRAKLRAEIERRIKAELKRRCKNCPSRAEAGQ